MLRFSSSFSPGSPVRSSPLRRTSLPVSSPSRFSAKTTYSDRFIPSRTGSTLEYNIPPISNTNENNFNNFQKNNTKESTQSNFSPYHCALQTHLLNVSLSPPHKNTPSSPLKKSSIKINSNIVPRTLKFHSPLSRTTNNDSPYSISPIRSINDHSIVRRQIRKIPNKPFKILDAPCLSDDFYLNVLDWSSSNMLVVGLDSTVYVWNAWTSKVTKICDVLNYDPQDKVTSTQWLAPRSNEVAIGTLKGNVHIYNTEELKLVRTLDGHQKRVGSLAWNKTTNMLASGCRDNLILLRDPRTVGEVWSPLIGHEQEVCGLKWSSEDRMLASGGNDNRACIWSLNKTDSPVHVFKEHQSAVRAMAWSPHQEGIFVTGGGTADRKIRFWNVTTGSKLATVEAGSQVCCVMWSKSVNELVTTHGYSQNNICIWKYPSLEQIATLTGHQYRVLYLAMSPDGQTIVTGAGDETLRFWNVFPASKPHSRTRSLFDEFLVIN